LKLVTDRIELFSTEEEVPMRVGDAAWQGRILKMSTDAGTNAGLPLLFRAGGITEDLLLAFSTWNKLSKTDGPTLKPSLPALMLHTAAFGAEDARALNKVRHFEIEVLVPLFLPTC